MGSRRGLGSPLYPLREMGSRRRVGIAQSWDSSETCAACCARTLRVIGSRRGVGIPLRDCVGPEPFSRRPSDAWSRGQIVCSQEPRRTGEGSQIVCPQEPRRTGEGSRILCSQEPRRTGKGRVTGRGRHLSAILPAALRLVGQLCGTGVSRPHSLSQPSRRRREVAGQMHRHQLSQVSGALVQVRGS